ncbi:MAG: choice-of-anchor D domain-containing protein [Myxococcota bacterium]
MRRTFALFPILTACAQDQGFGKVDDVAGGQGPDIEVSPARIDFGALGAGEVATQTFTVTNVGPEESILDVSEITIGGEAAGFTIVTPAEDLAFTLPGGASTSIEVAFTPLGANASGTAIVASDDEDEKRVSVELLGQGLVPELQIEPDPLDLGTAYIGCDKDHDVTLTNVGSDTLVIDAITHTGGEFVLTDENTLPLSLDPGSHASVNVRFVPTVEGSFTGQLTVTSNEPMRTRVSDHTAEGAYAGEYEDTFEVPENPPVDIVFYVDRSGSMDDDARALADNFSRFISEISLYTSNWHIIVTNDDDGCRDSVVLTSSIPSYEDRFTEFVMRGGGGLWTEAGLTIVTNAVEATGTSECNAGFLRGSALLHIIMVSDEEEQSMRDYSHYVNRIIAEKGDASLVKLSAVAGDHPSGCSSGGNSAVFGSGYYEAVRDTGGEYLSICSDWAASVEALAGASVSASNYELSRTPAPATIVVSVNGTERAGGWTYDEATNSVVFDPGRTPEEGDTVTVTYAGLASCD